MRITHLRVGGFGRLRDLDSGAAPLPGLVVVSGPNEAGKSTLFHFLTSMLYGFAPASRDGNPYTPWDGHEAGGSLTLSLDSGEGVEVERRLLAQPTGRMESGGSIVDLRNRALPWVEHVPRQVFRQVFALTLHEMGKLDGDAWDQVQDRLLGSMGSTDLRSVRDVVAELEQEAGEIWRTNRRGNQLARTVAGRILEVRSLRRKALDADRRVREATAELAQTRDALAEARRARHEAIHAADRVQALIPIRAQIRRIEALRGDQGPASDLLAIPPDPAGSLEALRARVEEARNRLEAHTLERVEPQADIAAFGAAEAALVERADAINAFVSRVAALASERERVDALRQEGRDIRRRMEGVAAQLLSSPLDGDLEAALLRVPGTELRERIRRWHQLGEERRRRQEAALRAPAPSPTPAAPPIVAILAVLLSGFILMGVGATMQSTAVLALGAGVTAIGIFLGVGWASARRRTGNTAPTDGMDPQEGQEAEALGRVRELLSALPILPHLRENPTDTLTAGVERFQELQRDERERVQGASEITQRLVAADEEAASLSGELGRGVGLDAAALAHLLDRDLRQAERLAERAASARRILDRVRREEERARSDHSEALAAFERLSDRIRAVGQGNLEDGLRTVRDRMAARDRADRLEEELERAHPDIEETRARIRDAEGAGESWTVEDDDLPRRRAEAEELTQRVETLATRVESLEKDLEALRGVDTVDSVDGEIAALQAQELHLREDRDRRWLMAQLLREADRRFREEHQPDVLRRAGRHLERLTGGRYDRLSVDDALPGSPFVLTGRGAPDSVPLAPPISTGTLEQTYLALRLAIVDHLDQGVERLPLFVDEVLVNWDPSRFGIGVDLLGELARDRQLFVFTCQPATAAALAAVGAAVLDLDGPK